MTSHDLIRSITDYYNSVEGDRSIKATSRKFGISEGAVRKALITTGAYETDLSRRIAELRKVGYTTEEICEKLNRCRSAIDNSSPYSKGTYLIQSQTRNAEAIRRFRKAREQT